MFVAAFTFALSVLSFYCFYRYFIQHNDDYKYFVWEFGQLKACYLTMMLTVIYNANRMINEVNQSFLD